MCVCIGQSGNQGEEWGYHEPSKVNFPPVWTSIVDQRKEMEMNDVTNPLS